MTEFLNQLEKSELLHRQVHPNMVQKGRPSSKIFTPTVKDQGKLSSDRANLLSAKDAYERYLAKKNLVEAGGAWGVTVEEFNSAGLPCYSDPVEGNEAHALTDFKASSDDFETLGAIAYRAAIARGRLWPAS